MLRNVSLIFLFTLCFFILSPTWAAEFEVDGHKVEFEARRGASNYSIDGKSFLHSGQIRLKKNDLVGEWRIDDSEPQLFIIQFQTTIFQSYQKDLKAQDIEIIKFVPDHALLVQGRRDQIMELHNQMHIKQVVEFGSGYKLASLPSTLWVNPDSLTEDAYDVLPTADRHRGAILMQAQQMGLTVLHSGLDSFALTIQGDLQAVLALARNPKVLWVEVSPDRIEEDMDVVLQQGGVTSLIQTTGSYQGEGIRGHVLEGVYKDHQDFIADAFRQAPIAVGDGTSSYHGQQTFGIIYGSGAGDSLATGIMPRAQGYYTNNKFVYEKDNRQQLTEELIRDHEILLQTASWGSPTTDQYTARSLEMDKIIFELDIPVTQSQSNRSSQQSRPQAWAKNIISVGAVHHGNNTSFADDSWQQGGASIGPATDNRIKPDIVSYYDDIHTTGSQKYSTFGGTSAATPIVNGHLGLIIEMFTDGLFGNVLKFPKDNRFANRPHASTAKALLINSARQYNFQGLDHDLTRTHQGWGHPDLQTLYDRRHHMRVINEDDVLRPLDKKVYEFEVEESAPQLAATMVYTDPDGLVGAQIHRVNDLDLTVIAPDGRVFHGNNGLYESNFSVPGGTADTVNTVENVFIDQPMPGRWTVEVVAMEINQDGHLETEDVDADFALVVSGIKTQRPEALK